MPALARAAGLAAAAALVAATPAAACMAAPRDPATIIHAALPSALPEGAIVADVVFQPGSLLSEALHRAGVRARVTRVVRGPVRGPVMIVRQSGLRTGCDRPEANGESGLIVALPMGFEQGVLVVEPILATRLSGLRLPDGSSYPRR